MSIPNILLIDVFSPIDIQIIDPDGNKIGKNFDGTKKEFNEIPGAFYTGCDTENEFITIPNPKDGEYKILAQGTGNGAYKIKAVKISEDENNPFGEAIESSAEIAGTAVLDEQKEFKITITGDMVKNENQEVISSSDEKKGNTVQVATTIQADSGDDNNNHGKDSKKSDKKSKKTKTNSTATFSVKDNKKSSVDNFANPFGIDNVFANTDNNTNNFSSAEKVAGAQTDEQNNFAELKTGNKKQILLIFFSSVLILGVFYFISRKVKFRVK